MALPALNPDYVLNQTLFGIWLSTQRASAEPQLESANVILEISRAHGELPARFEAAPWLRFARLERLTPEESSGLEPSGIWRVAPPAVPPLFARRLSEASPETLQVFGNFFLGLNLSLTDIASRHQRQEVRDLVEAESYRRLRAKPDEHRLTPALRIAMASIDDAEGSLYDDLRKEFGGGPEDAESILELVHEIIHRDRPLGLITAGSSLRARVEAFMDHVIRITQQACPEDWGGVKKLADRNLVSGAPLLGQKEKLFRSAWMILNARLGRPLLGPPALRERSAVIDFAVSFLEEENVRSFSEALIRIRDHFDRCTPQALKAIARADMETRGYVVEAYFGLFPFRVVPDLASAFRLVRAIGEAGFYREVAVSTFPNTSGFGVSLSLGDIAGVNAENDDDTFVLHTHPWVGYLSEEETAPFSIEDARFVFSAPDMVNAKMGAMRLHRMSEKGDFSYSPLSFNTDAHRHGQWLQAFEGAAYMEVSVGAEGLISGLKVFYGLHPDRNADMNEEALFWRCGWFEHMYGRQVGAPIQYIRRSYEDILVDFPYGP